MNIENLVERERIITKFVEFLFFFLFFLSLDTRIFVYKISFSRVVIVTILFLSIEYEKFR